MGKFKYGTVHKYINSVTDHIYLIKTVPNKYPLSNIVNIINDIEFRVYTLLKNKIKAHVKLFY